jgi:hypothetical protein
MSWLLAALVSFASIALMLTHLSPRTMLRLVGYAGFVDVLLHSTILYMFVGTSTLGLLQAEACGIMFSVGLRLYRKLFGYMRLKNFRWVTHPGVIHRFRPQ